MVYSAPIVSFTVDDVAQSRRELERRQVAFVAPIFRTKQGWGWTYFRAPDGQVYQLQGAARGVAIGTKRAGEANLLDGLALNRCPKDNQL